MNSPKNFSPFLLFFCLPTCFWAANTTIIFQPGSPGVGPFPSNALTTPSEAQKTGLVVHMPLPPGCSAASTDNGCKNITLINQLDGFSVNPLVTVCFSGPIDPGTLGAGVSFINADTARPSIGIQQILYDPVSHCAYAKPNRVLDQQTRYLFSITSGVTDAAGKRVKASGDFRACIGGSSPYCQALTTVFLQHNRNNGADLGDVVAASLFTTMSATTWMEKARAFTVSLPPAVLPAGLKSTFRLSEIESITWQPQTGVTGVHYDQPIPLDVLGGVESISFGLFLSPLYLQVSGPMAGTIPTTPTNLPVAAPTLIEPVSYHVFLPPESSRPAAGFPVIIYGHGLSDSQFGAPTYAASTWARKGFATVAMEMTGHGFGSGSTTSVRTQSGSYTLATPGRGIQLNPAAPIGPSDGCILPGAVATRDCSRQTALDLSALVGAIRGTGLGVNLNPSKIYYVGQSFGSFYGTVFEAVEPYVTAGALNSGGGTQTQVARLSPIARQLGALYLSGFAPPLLNVPPAPPQDFFRDLFNDQYVYPDQVATASVPGALGIQAAFEQSDWLGMLGDPLSFAPHLQTSPLAGISPKGMLVQFGLGDLEVPNATESALVRAGGLQWSAWVLNTLVEASIDPTFLSVQQPPAAPFPIYPHRFLSNPTLFSGPGIATAVGLAAQSQIGDFFVSGGAAIPDPNRYMGPYSSAPLFQPFWQMDPGLLDGLNFIQIAR
jgi:hypothetical protein